MLVAKREKKRERRRERENAKTKIIKIISIISQQNICVSYLFINKTIN